MLISINITTELKSLSFIFSKTQKKTNCTGPPFSLQLPEHTIKICQNLSKKNSKFEECCQENTPMNIFMCTYFIKFISQSKSCSSFLKLLLFWVLYVFIHPGKLSVRNMISFPCEQYETSQFPHVLGFCCCLFVCLFECFLPFSW